VDAKKKQLKTSTWVEYDRVVKNILVPKLGHHTLSGLKRAHVKEILVDLNVTNKRLANIQSVLRSALHDAVTDDILESNPMYEWCYQNKDVAKKVSDVDPFSRDEQASILGACSGQVQNLFRFAFWTGMRTSELVALNWSDIDWERGVIQVTNVLTQDSEEFEVPKTAAGRREIKILPPALEALIAQKPFTLLKGQEVFQNPRHSERWQGDQPIRQSYWTPTLVKAEVRYRRPYQTRHTYASMMLSAGESPMWVANQMGHSDWSMITKVYGKWIPDAAPHAGQKAVDAFGGVTS